MIPPNVFIILLKIALCNRKIEKIKKMLHSAIDNDVAQCYNSLIRKEETKLINTNKIKGRMSEMQLTQKDIAEKMGLAQPTVNQKINNIRPMDLDEAEKLSDILKISEEEFPSYFFYRGSCAVQLSR